MTKHSRCSVRLLHLLGLEFVDHINYLDIDLILTNTYSEMSCTNFTYVSED